MSFSVTIAGCNDDQWTLYWRPVGLLSTAPIGHAVSRSFWHEHATRLLEFSFRLHYTSRRQWISHPGFGPSIGLWCAWRPRQLWRGPPSYPPSVDRHSPHTSLHSPAAATVPSPASPLTASHSDEFKRWEYFVSTVHNFSAEFSNFCWHSFMHSYFHIPYSWNLVLIQIWLFGVLPSDRQIKICQTFFLAIYIWQPCTEPPIYHPVVLSVCVMPLHSATLVLWWMIDFALPFPPGPYPYHSYNPPSPAVMDTAQPWMDSDLWARTALSLLESRILINWTKHFFDCFHKFQLYSSHWIRINSWLYVVCMLSFSPGCCSNM